MDPAELAGHATRTMVAQDARWIADAGLSLQQSGGSGWLSLVMLGFSSRIVYEGSLAAESKNLHVGVPAIATELSHRHDETIARSRHGGKFLDDSQRPLPELKTEMLAFYKSHQDEFLGNAVWFARWLETDIGVCLGPSGEVLTSSITGHFRMGLESGIRISESGEDSFELARTQGSALALLSLMADDDAAPDATMDFAALGPVTDFDRRADRYLSNRYDPMMDIATKLILLMIEGELNSTALILAPAAAPHDESTFRARIVSLFHSLRGIDEILTETPNAMAPSTARLRSLLRDPAMRRWLDEKSLRHIRNRCMHYEIRQPNLALTPSLPMSGIVEAISPDDTFESLNAEAIQAGERLREAMNSWVP